jgi:uncharacterized membrane protein YphA (DoxX/SURF4 family)/peroxiredoxin
VSAALLVARLVLAALFLVAGLAKLGDITGSRRAVSEFGVPIRFVPAVALAVPLCEIAVAVALLPRGSARWGALTALLLLLGFLGAIGRAIAGGYQPDCHCFGQLHSAPAGKGTFLRNLALAGIAGFVLIGGWADPGPSALAWVPPLSPLQGIALAVGAALTCLISFQIWFSLHLLRQNGRLFYRLEALERLLGVGSATPSTGNLNYAAGRQHGLPVGSAAPGFTLPDLYGVSVTLDGLRAGGLPTLLIFSDPDCGPCNSLLPRVALWQSTHAAHTEILLVTRGEVEKNQAKATTHGLRNVLLQRDREVSAQYLALGTPSGVVVDRFGRVGSRLAEGPAAIADLVQQTVNDREPILRVVGSNPRQSASGSAAPRPAYHACDPAAASIDQPDTTTVGETVQGLGALSLDGNRIQLGDFTGRPLIVLLWDPSCGYCQQILHDLRAWERGRSSAAPELLVMSTGHPDATRALSLESTVVLAPGPETGRRLGLTGTPSAVLIDATGCIAAAPARGGPAVLRLLSMPAASATIQSDLFADAEDPKSSSYDLTGGRAPADLV